MLTAYLVAIASATIGQTSTLTYVATLTQDLQYPGRVAVMPGGGVYVTDQPSGTVIEFDAAGAHVATYSLPELPVGIAVDAGGTVYVSRRDGQVGVYDPTFALQSTLDPGPAVMTGPNGMAIDDAAGEIYVVDSLGHQVLVFNMSTGTLARVWGTQGSGFSEFQSPQSIALDAALGHVIVTDADNFRLQVFDTAGVYQYKIGYRTLFAGPTEVAWFARSVGVAVDACSNIYVADALMGTIRAFDAVSRELDLGFVPMVDYGPSPGALRIPIDLAIGGATLYVSSNYNAAVEVYGLSCSPPLLPLIAPRPTPGPSDAVPAGSRKSRHARRLHYPDNPFDIVEAIADDAYATALDVNDDRQVDMTDLELAVEHFGGSCVEDFLPGPLANSFPFDLRPPHMIGISNVCGRCHAMDGLPGGMLSVVGQENLCLSCHSSSAVGMNLPIPGLNKGNAHPIGVLADAGQSLGPDSANIADLDLHLDNGTIRCATCHDPHVQTAGQPYLRDSNHNGALCKQCHRGAQAPKEHGTVQVEYCTDCHDVHADCGTNLHLIKRTFTNASTLLDVSVNFTDASVGVGPGAFVELGPTQGLCESCHDNYENAYLGRPPVMGNTGLGVLHTATMLACTKCHLHHNGFKPGLDINPNAGYIGSALCGVCHVDTYAKFLNNGHAYKLHEIVGGQVPSYPFSSIVGALGMINDDDTDPLDPKAGTDNTLGTPAGYNDISFVIGGFGWKARWIDALGYIVTGSEVQYNLETQAMVSYHDNETDKPYNCGNCHTTGWRHYTFEPGDTRNLNRQNDLPGMDGTFAAPGVHCEACHGKGSAHAVAPSPFNITRVATARTTADFLATDMAHGEAVACSDCHTRDGEKDYPTYVGGPGRIAAKGGLIKHHEQYDEMIGINPDDNPAFTHTGPHRNLSCTACHDPHATTKYMAVSGDPPGISKHCAECHNPAGVGAKDYSLYGQMAALECIDCHMPRLSKSAVTHAAVGTGPITGDIRSHIFRINLTTTTQFTADGNFAYPWVTGEWACKTCHNGMVQFGSSFPDFVTVIHNGSH